MSQRSRRPGRGQEPPADYYTYTPLKDWEFCPQPGCTRQSEFSIMCLICRRVFHPDCVGLPDADFKTFKCIDCIVKPEN